ncbi:MAG: class I SAM-dependent methyltransferase, partial [Dehalococcoidia bacterium]|nr:class I SAM-dependent methyltransferase [Dehalococcoidia bacterium]
IVHAFILFHEIPVEVGHRVIAEARRVLRPGGVFAVVDFPNRPASAAATIAGYTRDFDTRDNGEQFASDFVYSDFTGALVAAGFRRVDPNAVPDFWLPVRICEK